MGIGILPLFVIEIIVIIIRIYRCKHSPYYDSNTSLWEGCFIKPFSFIFGVLALGLGNSILLGSIAGCIAIIQYQANIWYILLIPLGIAIALLFIGAGIEWIKGTFANIN